MTTDIHDDRTDSPPARPAVPAPAKRRPGTVGPRAAASPPQARSAPRPSPSSPKPAPGSATTASPAGRDAEPSTSHAVDIPLDANPGPSRVRLRLVSVVALVGVLGTLGFGLAWNHARTHQVVAGAGTAQTGAAQSVRAAAVAFSNALTNFDGSSIDRDFDRLVGLSTGGFRDQANQFFSAKTRMALKVAQASSRGEIRQAFVQSMDDTTASVFVVVDQTIANNKSPQPQADTLRMDLTLKATQGTWLVDQVDVLTAPGGSSTLTPAASGSSGTGG